MSKKFPGLTSEKIPQNAPQWISVCQKISRELLVKIPQSASKWMSILKKSQGVACENGSKCTKMDIRFSKIFQG